MKKLFFTLAFLLIMSGYAMGQIQSFHVDGIKYERNITWDWVNVAGDYETYKDLETIVIPDEVTYNDTIYPVLGISSHAFKNCAELKRIELPAAIRKIDWYAFENCTSLESLHLPDSLVELPGSVLSGCKGLQELGIGQKLKRISVDFNWPFKIRKLIFNAEKFEGVGDYTTCAVCEFVPFDMSEYFDWENLETVEIGDQVKVLPYGFLKGSPITNITLPASLREMCGFTFAYCTQLRDIHCLVSDPSLIEMPMASYLPEFQDVDKTLCTLYVPRGAAERYRQADQWKDFQNIVEEGEYDPCDLNHDGLVDVTDVNIIIDRILGKK